SIACAADSGLPQSAMGHEWNAGLDSQHLWDMRREENRWQSFHLPDASFTAAHLVSVTDLAADGFFYLQETDRVKCAFCKGVLKGWKAGEQVREAHRRHFSTCPFVLFVEVGNVPREHREPEGASRFRELPNEVAVSALGFRSAASVLACKGGLLLLESERATCCFSCGLRVNDWSCSDDVWIEHARWSPRCPHVLLERGSDFVRTVHRLSPPVQHPTCAASARRRTALVQSGSTVSASFATVDESVAPTAVRSSRVDQSLAVTPGVEFRVEAKDINARADLPVLRLLTQLGFSALQVKLFTELHLRQRGDDFATSELFLDFMLSESRRMRKQSQDPEAFFESRMSQIRESLNQQPRHRDTIDWKTCKVCMDNEVNVMLLDCGHLNICSPCANSVTSCPICTAYIRGTVLIKI
uniref:RING-type domain-containing protein n=1 Tax=Macrostomum lignano TaxID=282301 RepID=A0A1I8IA74_9PLAT